MNGIEERAINLKDNFLFPSINDRMSEGSRSVMKWVLAHLNNRSVVNLDESKSRLFLDEIG